MEVVTHTDGEITFEGTQPVNGQMGTIRLRHLLDGRTSVSDVQGVALRSTAKWEGSTLVVHSEAVVVNQGTVEKEDRFTLSSDGKALTQVQKVLSGNRATTTMVFDRQ